MRPTQAHAPVGDVRYFLSQAGVLFEAVTIAPSKEKPGHVSVSRVNAKKERVSVGDGFFQPSADGKSIQLTWAMKRSLEIMVLNVGHKVKDKGIDMIRPVLESCVSEANRRGLNRVTLETSSALASYYEKYGFRTVRIGSNGDHFLLLEW